MAQGIGLSCSHVFYVTKDIPPYYITFILHGLLLVTNIMHYEQFNCTNQFTVQAKHSLEAQAFFMELYMVNKATINYFAAISINKCLFLNLSEANVGHMPCSRQNVICDTLSS